MLSGGLMWRNLSASVRCPSRYRPIAPARLAEAVALDGGDHDHDERATALLTESLDLKRAQGNPLSQPLHLPTWAISLR